MGAVNAPRKEETTRKEDEQTTHRKDGPMLAEFESPVRHCLQGVAAIGQAGHFHDTVQSDAVLCVARTATVSIAGKQKHTHTHTRTPTHSGREKIARMPKEQVSNTKHEQLTKHGGLGCTNFTSPHGTQRTVKEAASLYDGAHQHACDVKTLHHSAP